MIEKFHIPCVAGIIEKKELGIKKILIQERNKPDAPREKGLIEIPAGKIREFENIFDSLRREVFEETGLKVTNITEEDQSDIVQNTDYKVLGCEPYFVSQNLIGYYPILVITFLCKAMGNKLDKSNESENIKWISIDQLRKMLINQPEKFYPMHISALIKYTNDHKKIREI